MQKTISSPLFLLLTVCTPETTVSPSIHLRRPEHQTKGINLLRSRGRRRERCDTNNTRTSRRGNGGKSFSPTVGLHLSCLPFSDDADFAHNCSYFAVWKTSSVRMLDTTCYMTRLAPSAYLRHARAVPFNSNSRTELHILIDIIPVNVPDFFQQVCIITWGSLWPMSYPSTKFRRNLLSSFLHEPADKTSQPIKQMGRGEKITRNHCSPRFSPVLKAYSKFDDDKQFSNLYISTLCCEHTVASLPRGHVSELNDL